MYQYKPTRKEKRLEELRERMKSLEAAREAALDAADEAAGDDDAAWNAALREIRAKYDPQIERVVLAMQAAHLPSPRNKWFLEVMKGFCDKCRTSGIETRGLKEHSFHLTPRQAETFGRYITCPTRRDGTERGCEVPGFLITLSVFNTLKVTCYE